MNAKQKKLDKAVRLVAANCYMGGGYNVSQGYWLGDWAYAAFDWINPTLFDSRLPTPLILWDITPHGKCLGYTHSRSIGVPRVVLHPATIGFNEVPKPWGIEQRELGPRYALDVLIHECIHVSVGLMGGWGRDTPCEGSTSHNNNCWVSEVNRIAPLLGLNDIKAGRSKTRRVKVAGKRGKRGALPTKVERFSDGNIPHDSVARFPNPLRKRRYYLGRAVPFEVPV